MPRRANIKRPDGIDIESGPCFLSVYKRVSGGKISGIRALEKGEDTHGVPELVAPSAERPGDGLSWRKWAIVILFAIIQVVIAAQPLLTKGWFVSEDGRLHIERVAAVSYAVRHGDFYPRWTMVAAFKKGSPFLNFYPPGFYLAAGYLHALGIHLVPSVKAVCMTFFLLGWIGMFLWGRRHFDIWGALIAATMFTFVPYHFNDLYTRGALPEFAAINLLPFLFYGIDLTYSEGHNFPGIAVTAAAVAAITVTHNLIGFMIAPFAALYIGWRTFSAQAGGKMFLKAAAGVALGIGLCAFYWLPVLTEIGYLYKFRETILGAIPYYKYFIPPARWFSAVFSPDPIVQTTLSGQYWIKWQRHQNFQIGSVLLGFAVLSLAALFKSPRGKKVDGLVLLALGTAALFMTIPPAAVLYESFALLQYVLFPWSYLGPATMFFAALTGYSSGLMPSNRIITPAALLFLAFALCVLVSIPERTVSCPMQIKENISELRTGSAFDEFRPKWESAPVTLKIFDPVYSNPDTRIALMRFGGPEIRLLADAARSGSVVITQFYFPGWKLRIDGRDSPISTTREGFMAFRVPEGKHVIKLWFGTTWPRIAGWCISIITAALIITAAIWRRLLLKQEFRRHPI